MDWGGLRDARQRRCDDLTGQTFHNGETDHFSNSEGLSHIRQAPYVQEPSTFHNPVAAPQLDQPTNTQPLCEPVENWTQAHSLDLLGTMVSSKSLYDHQSSDVTRYSSSQPLQMLSYFASQHTQSDWQTQEEDAQRTSKSMCPTDTAITSNWYGCTASYPNFDANIPDLRDPVAFQAFGTPAALHETTSTTSTPHDPITFQGYLHSNT
jgi:hypothetical protein